MMDRITPYSFCLAIKLGFISVDMQTLRIQENLMLIHGVPLHNVKIGVWCAISATTIIADILFLRPYIYTDTLTHIRTPVFEHLSDYDSM